MPYTIRRRISFMKIIVGLTSLLFVGTLSYHLIEDWAILDSLYMAVITLSTVGFREVHPLSQAGRAFTVFYILGGVSLVTYGLSILSRLIIEGELQQFMGRRRTMTKINKLKDHYIICGFGRIGQMVANEFESRNTPYVVIERDHEQVSRMDQDFPVVVGDGTEEEILKAAGIERAKGLVTVLLSDADNLFVTLSSRELNPKLKIIARYEEERSRNKLLRAGADKVVSPYIIGGTRMAMAVLRPAVIDFIELATQSESLGLQMEEVEVGEGSPLNGVKLMDSRIRDELEIIVVAVKKKSGHMVFNPAANMVIEEGDKLIAIGETAQLTRMVQLVAGPIAGFGSE